MAARRITGEYAARLLAIGLAIGLPLGLWLAARAQSSASIEIHARNAESGGWSPSNITVAVGQPLRLRLISDDVMHSFAIGQSDRPAIDLPAGQAVNTTLTFSAPGKYTFYCTRWCSPGHWRMRGVIEVLGPTAMEMATPAPPLYAALGLDLDAKRNAAVTPSHTPSAARGAALGLTLPARYLLPDNYRTHSPAELWQTLRADPLTVGRADSDVWDLVALVWQANIPPQSLAEGRALFATNCAACHGEGGKGDGVMAEALSASSNTQRPADFTNAQTMLAASPALLQGKIIRGGMGTGMPYWGPIFTEAQTWSLVGYLWAFQFELGGG